MGKERVSLFVFAALLGILTCIANQAAASDANPKSIFIIGNRELPFDSIRRDELEDIFNCRKTMWDENQKIEIAILQQQEIHRKFVRSYVRGTSVSYRNYREENRSSAGNCSLISFKSEKSVVSHVALTKGAIGYISSHTKPVGVKVIKIIEEY